MTVKECLDNVYKITALILALLNIISFLAKLLWVTDESGRQVPVIPLWVPFLILLSSAVLLLIIFCVKRINSHKVLAQYMHECIHAFRDELYDMKTYCTPFISRTGSKNHIYQYMVEKAERLCSTIQNAFSKLFNTEFCICIKIIWEKNDKGKAAYVKTLCRSSNVNASRKENDHKPISVIGNSDFEEILLHNKNIFSIRNIPKVLKANKEGASISYKNTSKNPSYKSTVVCPIRIKAEHLVMDKKKVSDEYNIIALLCLDSDSILSQLNIKIAEKLMSGFADMLYPFFHEFYQIDQKCN